jgi:hypothetical protein
MTATVEQVSVGVYRTTAPGADGLVVSLLDADDRWHQCGDIVICSALEVEEASRCAEVALSRFSGAVVIAVEHDGGCVLVARAGETRRFRGQLTLSIVIDFYRSWSTGSQVGQQ